TEMERQVSWAAGKPGVEDVFLAYQADTEAFFGRLGRARELVRRAIESARRNDEKETAAAYEAGMAWTEADLGNTERARQGVAAALFQSPAPDVQVWAAIVLARAADSAR